jgi:hypothetical protein
VRAERADVVCWVVRVIGADEGFRVLGLGGHLVGIGCDGGSKLFRGNDAVLELGDPTWVHRGVGSSSQALSIFTCELSSSVVVIQQRCKTQRRALRNMLGIVSRCTVGKHLL